MNDDERKGCPALTMGILAGGGTCWMEPCRGEDCQLWWFCSGQAQPVFVGDQEQEPK